MRPGARIASAIEVLDQVLRGDAAERSLTNWARQNRFAGSGDRAAIRDHVFDALRCRRSYGALGGAQTGRGLMIGALRAAGQEPAELFDGVGYAPAPLSVAEAAMSNHMRDLSEAERLDCPDWLVPELSTSLGEDFAPVMGFLRQRAPVFLRVNQRKATRSQAMAELARDGITARAHILSPSALEVLENPRKIKSSEAFTSGLVELQDAASQAVVDLIPTQPGARVLDFCAGGGGKALALAMRPDIQVFAHDVNPQRMRDIPDRSRRAGAEITILHSEQVTGAAAFDIVLADAPCSGAGSWRRSPQGKWDLTRERLDELCGIQGRILSDITDLVRPGGLLVYATCSLLECENGAQIDRFLADHPAFKPVLARRFTPLDGGDGFFVAIMTR